MTKNRYGVVMMIVMVVMIGMIGMSGVNAAIHNNTFHTAKLNDNMELHWRIIKDEVLITVEGNYAGWLGFGIHKFGSLHMGMTNADFVVATFDSNGKIDKVNDMFADDSTMNGFAQPLMDEKVGGEQNILESYGFQNKETGFSTFTFRRKLKTNDSKADHEIVNGDQRFIFAHGDQNSANPNMFAFHGANNMGGITLNMFTGTEAPPGFDFKDLHGSMMVLAFAFCFLFGAFAARYLKAHEWWFPLHVTTQVAGALIALGSFFVITTSVVGPHFYSLHAVFGLMTISLMVIVVFIGLAADRKYDPERRFVPVWPDKIHWWAARILMVLSQVTIVLGMLLHQVPYPVIIVFGVFLTLVVLITIQQEIRRNRELLDHRSNLYSSLGQGFSR